MKEFVATDQEALQLNPDDVDVHIDEAHGPIQIKTWDGRSLKYDGHIPGLGADGRALLDDLMRTASKLVDARYLQKNPLLQNITEPAIRAQAIRRLRKALHDTVTRCFYIYIAVRPWRVRWHQERAWRIIEPLPE